eukprot:1193572-Prorocentrum_minimum.AAC.2
MLGQFRAVHQRRHRRKERRAGGGEELRTFGHFRLRQPGRHQPQYPLPGEGGQIRATRSGTPPHSARGRRLLKAGAYLAEHGVCRGLQEHAELRESLHRVLREHRLRTKGVRR